MTPTDPTATPAPFDRRRGRRVPLTTGRARQAARTLSAVLVGEHPVGLELDGHPEAPGPTWARRLAARKLGELYDETGAIATVPQLEPGRPWVVETADRIRRRVEIDVPDPETITRDLLRGSREPSAPRPPTTAELADRLEGYARAGLRSADEIAEVLAVPAVWNDLEGEALEPLPLAANEVAAAILEQRNALVRAGKRPGRIVLSAAADRLLAAHERARLAETMDPEELAEVPDTMDGGRAFGLEIVVDRAAVDPVHVE